MRRLRQPTFASVLVDRKKREMSQGINFMTDMILYENHIQLIEHYGIAAQQRNRNLQHTNPY